jgi:uncharacterized protein
MAQRRSGRRTIANEAVSLTDKCFGNIVSVRASRLRPLRVTKTQKPRRSRRTLLDRSRPFAASGLRCTLPRLFSTVLFAAAVCLGASIQAGCRSGPPEGTDSAAEIAAARAAKETAFEAGADSPVPVNRRAELLPLAYFPIDLSYSVPAVLEPSSEQVTVEMPTSTGEHRKMHRVGKLEFVLKGQPMTLSAFTEAGAPDVDHLFVPFADLTTGTETYAGGRYLDLDRNATGIYLVDFNRAYQPYCYFNPTFDCPYPPAENRLKVPIRAGERLKTANK